MGVAKAVPQLGAMVWWDQKPVHVLATGASRAMLTCERRISGGKGQTTTAPCPSMIRDYQKWMGGVDVHDQLRLQRYSLQLAVKFTKYYKTIALGMIDMAITNAYICQREARKAEGKPAADHAKFLLGLHAQLIAMTDADFEDTMFSPGPATPTRKLSPTTAHSLTPDDEWVVVGGVVKYRQRQCKVCSLRKQKIGERHNTRFYCSGCCEGNKRVYLCDHVRPEHYPGNSLTCFAIWHSMWRDGKDRPRCGRDIQMRAPGMGKQKRRSGDESSGEPSDSGNESGGEEEGSSD
ncbi:hypothetical protein PR003_g5079 [Phytophthora rubi]|nr:hypothetical protein PR002_g5165 [Phytophthora rubi]KAE9351025.1 hypothetical protein PR003_g5079 [Phytophthora rubi]